jgi:FkbM family methyltransferase
MTTVHVACQTNTRFAADCAVMLHSLLSENPEEAFVVHFPYDETLPTTDLTGLETVVRGLGAAWDPVHVSDEEAAAFPSLARYGGVTAWFRLLLPRLLPEVERVLYLDADLLVTGPIHALWDTDLAGKCLAAVTNPVLGDDRRRVVEDLGLPDPARYFNSGVMLMDLVRLRDTGLMLEAERIARERSVPTPWADQEPLNAALWEQRLDLHPRWNLMNPCFDLPPRLLPWPAHQVREAVENPAIVHFIGPYKPWHYRLRHRYAPEYFRHLDKTPWRGRQREGRTLRHMLLRPLPPHVAMRYEAAEWKLKRLGRDTAHASAGAVGRMAARNPRIHAWLRALRRAARPRSAPPPLRDILDALSDGSREVCFIQIGSNDADHGDPLRGYVESHGWRGVLVEPVPYVFERLRTRYGSNRKIQLVNAAVATEDGRLPFYYVAESQDPGLPEWYDQIGSFVLEQVLDPYHVQEIPDLADRVVKAEVPCFRFETLWRNHPLPQVDVVHVDAEGYDDQILGQIDFAEVRPTIILYEHKHLSEARRGLVAERLNAHGYQILDLEPDSLAVRRDAPLLVRLAARRHRG